MVYDAIILGAGASGLMCAISAARRGRKIILIDRRQSFAQKLLASGGGRCNFTNLNVRPEDYVCGNAHFVKSALARFTPQDMISMIKKHRISFSVEEQGQLFLKGSSRKIFDMFMGELCNRGIKISIGNVKSIKKQGDFMVTLSTGTIRARKLVVATGGLSFKKLGATDLGYRIAKQFGHAVVPCRPALVPYLLAPCDQDIFSGLSGISFHAEVINGKKRFAGGCLIMHKGLSGPAMLKSSLYWDKEKEIAIDFMPGKNIALLLRKKRAATSRMELFTFLSRHMPARLAKALCRSRLPSKRVNELSDKDIGKIDATLHRFNITPHATAGFDKAEVTLGGVDTRELSSKTMESRLCSGLYFIGEVVDVTGDLGGYNLHWAWASASAAGELL
ncbi:MAG: aminoacetone oxidase family FAD-binding enzyme [Pseudomonadota bacterium]